MLTFQQFVAELAREDVLLSPMELQQMMARFGERVRQMGHMEPDGSMLVPVDCIVEAAQSLGTQKLTEAAESINSKQIAALFQSGEALVKRVIEARERKLRELIRKFQDEPDTKQSNHQWKQIEKEVFGVEYED